MPQVLSADSKLSEQNKLKKSVSKIGKLDLVPGDAHMPLTKTVFQLKAQYLEVPDDFWAQVNKRQKIEEE